MFTGIVESIGDIKSISAEGANKTFWVASEISDLLKVDQSVCHDGVCLTVEDIRPGVHRVTAIRETLKKTNLDRWIEGYSVNLERSMLLNGRLDGHIVQGHADTVATCVQKKALKGSWEFEFEFPKEFNHLLIEKGSICLNGISLTVFDVKKKNFKVAVIPYTFEHTNIKHVSPGSTVNIEFDMVGKYIARFKEIAH
ncbi:MAG: riboflavin synthase [Bacteroidetes bacterium]|nr:riboflavin synthase [Bacteroidota bacterium]